MYAIGRIGIAVLALPWRDIRHEETFGTRVVDDTRYHPDLQSRLLVDSREIHCHLRTRATGEVYAQRESRGRWSLHPWKGD
jgi:hypothetical protein